jgi:hypothetical protein
MPRLMGRSVFLKRVAGVVSGLVAALHGWTGFAKQLPKPYYVLNPFWATSDDGDTFCGGGCRSCKACVAHGANKLFIDPDTAVSRRAHANCDCQPELGGTLDYGTWMAVFKNGRLPSADRRHPRVQAILGH